MPLPSLTKYLPRLRKVLSTCPHPKKLKFRTRKAAAARALPLNMDVYKCVCGKWHMSSCSPDYAPPDTDWYDEMSYDDYRDW